MDLVETNELIEAMLDETANKTEAYSAEKPNRTARELQLIRYVVVSNDVLCNFWAKGPDHNPTYESNAQRGNNVVKRAKVMQCLRS